jgi:hypothetical protein
LRPQEEAVDAYGLPLATGAERQLPEARSRRVRTRNSGEPAAATRPTNRPMGPAPREYAAVPTPRTATVAAEPVIPEAPEAPDEDGKVYLPFCVYFGSSHTTCRLGRDSDKESDKES